ncbi:MAG TPA: GAF domain-containing protein [Steroidobacteraceae bacterium]|nr:GAF domain-containing protein [Steroidobacteraceae bacterium]
MAHAASTIDFDDKRRGYDELARQLEGLLSGERHRIANSANMAALLYRALPDVNWVGFYFLEDGELVVGPFQGKPACVRIALGRGVCGTAAARRTTLVVPDVHAFADHIACDADSNSEIVVPLIRGRMLIGVLDVDSPSIGRFDAQDRAGLEQLAAIFVASLDRG